MARTFEEIKKDIDVEDDLKKAYKKNKKKKDEMDIKARVESDTRRIKLERECRAQGHNFPDNESPCSCCGYDPSKAGTIKVNGKVVSNR